MTNERPKASAIRIKLTWIHGDNKSYLYTDGGIAIAALLKIERDLDEKTDSHPIAQLMRGRFDKGSEFSTEESEPENNQTIWCIKIPNVTDNDTMATRFSREQAMSFVEMELAAIRIVEQAQPKITLK